jgi:hypothetical protein
MGNYLDVANSPAVFLIVLVPVVFVLVQAVLFIRIGIRGMEKGTARKVIVNSAVFSIVPSLPIVITLAALILVLGTYIPWLRLSVIGSAIRVSPHRCL